jgi:hypothetical protein
MRSYIGKLVMVAALAAPLAALAADGATKPAENSAPCSMPCSGKTMTQQAPAPPQRSGMDALGGEYWPNSFDSP